MVPKLTAQGRSFKGAASYYLHDKREEGEAVRLSGERVAWTETINLPTTDPERAWRMMAYTAMAQAELKEAAGQAVTGKKLTKPVLAYSLSWHPDEQPTKADQLEAAQATLKVLGLEGHQAVIVCHNDEPQAHVHIIVNRVNPETGLANTGSFSQRKLQAWALDYERERGKIFCPKREENAERRAQGEKVYAPDTPRPVFEFNRATGNDNLTADFVQTEQKQKDAHLLSMGRTLKESHARQWADLKRIYAASKGKIFDHADQVKQQKLSLMNGENKLRWGDLFRKQRLERVAFEAMEEGTLSKLWNMASAIRELRQQDTEGHLLGTIHAILSGRQRRALLATKQERERTGLGREIKAEIKEAHRGVDQQAARDIEKLRNAYLGQCEHLRATQNQQTADMRTAWKGRNAERKVAMAPFRRDRTPARPKQPAQEQAVQQSKARERARERVRERQPPSSKPR